MLHFLQIFENTKLTTVAVPRAESDSALTSTARNQTSCYLTLRAVKCCLFFAGLSLLRKIILILFNTKELFKQKPKLLVSFLMG